MKRQKRQLIDTDFISHLMNIVVFLFFLFSLYLHRRRGLDTQKVLRVRFSTNSQSCTIRRFIKTRYSRSSLALGVFGERGVFESDYDV